MEKLTIGPFEIQEAQTIAGKLVELGVEFKTKTNSDVKVQKQTDMFGMAIEKASLFFEIQKIDFEANRSFFQSFGIEIRNHATGDDELNGYHPTGWLSPRKPSIVDNVFFAALALKILVSLSGTVSPDFQQNALVSILSPALLLIMAGTLIFSLLKGKYPYIPFRYSFKIFRAPIGTNEKSKLSKK